MNIYFMYARALTSLVLVIVLTGCVSIQDINSGYYRIGKTWQLENQRNEDEYRYRVIESDPITVFEATKKTFLALGMPVQSSDLEAGVLFAENVAPAPLTQEEWLEVKRIESPRLKEIGGQLFSFPEKPKAFVITVRAQVKPLKGGNVLIIVDHVMSSAEYKRIGVQVTPHAPPSAVKFGSAKFWNQLDKEIRARGIAAPQKRKWSEES